MLRNFVACMLIVASAVMPEVPLSGAALAQSNLPQTGAKPCAEIESAPGVPVKVRLLTRAGPGVGGDTPEWLAPRVQELTRRLLEKTGVRIKEDEAGAYDATLKIEIDGEADRYLYRGLEFSGQERLCKTVAKIWGTTSYETKDAPPLQKSFKGPTDIPPAVIGVPRRAIFRHLRSEPLQVRLFPYRTGRPDWRKIRSGGTHLLLARISGRGNTSRLWNCICAWRTAGQHRGGSTRESASKRTTRGPLRSRPRA